MLEKIDILKRSDLEILEVEFPKNQNQKVSR